MLGADTLFPFRFHRLTSDDVVAVSASGDHHFLSTSDVHALIHDRSRLKIETLLELKAKFFLGDPTAKGTVRLLASRLAARQETVLSGPSLHIIVPTLGCAHSCRYCQVSRSLDSDGASLSPNELRAACDSIFDSPARTLTVEFQGGDPLVRFDLVRDAILYLADRNRTEHRMIRFVVASTLHQLTTAMCDLFREHRVLLSTSLDGPRDLHDRNRTLATGDGYQRTISGIALARRALGHSAVSALMTTTRESLRHPESIVDEYVAHGFDEIFIRPMSLYGFAKHNVHRLGYSHAEFWEFYRRAFDRVLYWNREGVRIREVAASIALNKILSPFDAGYVDLQSPTGSGLATLVYNYDGFVYPSDEARMLAETGDQSLRLGRIGQSLKSLLASPVAHKLVKASLVRYVPGCQDCAFSTYCGPDPVQAQSQFGSMQIPIQWTDHCARQTWLFDFVFRWLKDADPWALDVAFDWARPGAGRSDA